MATNIKFFLINFLSETGRTVGGEFPREGEGVVLQPALPHHLHVPHEVQQVPLWQVFKNLLSALMRKLTFEFINNCCSHICPLKVGSTSHDDTRMTFGLRWNPILLLILIMIWLWLVTKDDFKMMRNNHDDDDDDDVFSRLTYKASGQNPVLDYMISVDELPERYLLPLLVFLCFFFVFNWMTTSF